MNRTGRLVVRVASILAVVLAGVVSACAPADSPDSPTDLDALPLLELVEEVRVGSVDDVEVGFEMIGTVRVHPSTGRVYVSDRAPREMRILDDDGRRVGVFGRRGEGPGEFVQLATAWGFRADTLWVIDAFAGRLSRFDLDGGLLDTEPLQMVTLTSNLPFMGVRYQPSRLWDGNRIYALPSPTGGGSASAEEARRDLTRMMYIPHLLFSLDGEVIDTLALEARRLDQVMTPPPMTIRGREVLLAARVPPRDPLVRVSPGWVDVIERTVATDATSNLVRATRTSHSGDTIFDESYRYTPKAYSGGIMDHMTRNWATSYLIQAARAGDDTVGARAVAREAIVASLDFPEFLPPLTDARVGDDGALWLQREDLPTPHREWVRIGPEGLPDARILVPNTVTLEWTSGDVAWAAVEDELGIHWLVRYRMRPAGEAAPG